MRNVWLSVKKIFVSSIYATSLFIATGLPQTAFAVSCNDKVPGQSFTYSEALVHFVYDGTKTYAIARSAVTGAQTIPDSFFAFSSGIDQTYRYSGVDTASLKTLLASGRYGAARPPLVMSKEDQDFILKQFRLYLGDVLSTKSMYLNAWKEFGTGEPFLSMTDGSLSYTNWPDGVSPDVNLINEPQAVVIGLDGVWKSGENGQRLSQVVEFDGKLDCALDITSFPTEPPPLPEPPPTDVNAVDGVVCSQDVDLDGDISVEEYKNCVTTPQGEFCPVGALDCTASYQDAVCPDGTSLNGDRDMCQADPQVTCPNGFTWDRTIDKCVLPEVPCPEGGQFNGVTDRCEKTVLNECTLPYQLSSDQAYCFKPVDCSSVGGVFVPERDRCEAPPKWLCTPPSQYVEAMHRCESVPGCLVGQYVPETDQCQIVPTYFCSDPTYIHVTEHSRCEKAPPQCAAGSYNSTYDLCLLPIVKTCDTASGYSYNAERDRCEKIPPDCPLGTKYNAVTNKCDGNVGDCSPGTYDPISGKCQYEDNDFSCNVNGQIFQNPQSCYTGCQNTAQCTIPSCTFYHYDYYVYLSQSYSIAPGTTRYNYFNNSYDGIRYHATTDNSCNEKFEIEYDWEPGVYHEVYPGWIGPGSSVSTYASIQNTTTVSCPLGSQYACTGSPSTCTQVGVCTSAATCPSGWTKESDVWRPWLTVTNRIDWGRDGVNGCSFENPSSGVAVDLTGDGIMDTPFGIGGIPIATSYCTPNVVYCGVHYWEDDWNIFKNYGILEVLKKTRTNSADVALKEGYPTAEGTLFIDGGGKGCDRNISRIYGIDYDRKVGALCTRTPNCINDEIFDNVTKSCQSNPTCLNGNFDPDLDVCYAPYITSCSASGMYPDLNIGYCVGTPLCPNGSLDGSLDVCFQPRLESCPPNSTLINGMCYTDASCVGTLDTNRDVCYSPAAVDCSGLNWDSAVGVCFSAVPGCEPGVYTPEANECRLPVTQNCGTYTWSEADQTCVLPITCPTDGSYALNNTIQYSSSLNKCVSDTEHHCIAGTTYFGVPVTMCEAIPICDEGAVKYEPSADACYIGDNTCPLGSQYSCMDYYGKMQCSANECFSELTPPGETVEAIMDESMYLDDARNPDGSCSGQIMIFGGKPSRCRPPGLKVGYINDCCESDQVMSEDVGNTAQAAVSAIKAMYQIGQVAYYSYLATQGQAMVVSGAIETATATVSVSSEVAAAVAAAEGAAAAGATTSSALMASMQTYASALLNPATIAVAIVIMVVMKVLMGSGCDQGDIQTGGQVESKQCHYIGNYCEKKIFSGCVQKARGYCCFNSIMARIVHEQGRPQLTSFGPDGAWGAPGDPNCRGFLPGEFESLDFSKIDMSEYYAELQKDMAKKIDGAQKKIEETILLRTEQIRQQ